MTQFEKLKAMNIDEMVDWLDENGRFDSSPWTQWWDSHYCNNCPTETAFVPDYGREMQFAWCELRDKCKFFSGLPNIPDNKDIIRMWLEIETNKTADDELDELLVAGEDRLNEIINFNKEQ